MFRASIRIAAVLFVALTSFAFAGQDTGSINVTSQGAPASGVDIFVFVNQGKQHVGTTGNQEPFRSIPRCSRGSSKVRR